VRRRQPEAEPEYTAHLAGALLLMREIGRITFEKDALEWFRRAAPGVRRELERRGVRFPERPIP